MKKMLVAAVAAVAFQFLAMAAGKPVYLVGDITELSFIQSYVTDEIPVKTEILDQGKWLDPARYGEAAAIVFGESAAMGAGAESWTDAKGAAALKGYLAKGGALVFTGQAWEQLATNATPELVEALSFPALTDTDFAKKTALGGTIYCCTQSIIGVRRYCQKNKIRLGEADGEGVYVPSEWGEKLDALTEKYAQVFKALKGTDRTAVNREWGIKPLGPMATSQPDFTLKNKPTFVSKPPVYKPGLKVLAPGSKARILFERKANVKGKVSTSWKLARELAWYMKAMSGLEAELVEVNSNKKKNLYVPTPDDVVVFVSDQFLAKEYFGIDFDLSPVGTSFLKRKGNWFLIGGNRSGASHALTYLLEQMGCRYLYPSEDGSGKIVPKTKEIVFPEIDWTYTPAVKHRGVRTPIPNTNGFVRAYGDDCKAHGWDPLVMYEKVQKFRLDPDDPENNRDFFAWHGVSDLDSLDGEYIWGHSYADYYPKYWPAHPEFFALQPNGSRDQAKVIGTRYDRIALCLSCPGLAEVTASNLVARFRAIPKLMGLSISLPDAGRAYQCMCENCRKLDPPNAKVNNMNFGKMRRVPYPALTDRVLVYANRVAALVKKEFPDKHLCFYAYGPYTSAPWLVKPDPMLVVLVVSGEYSTGAGATKSFASWANNGIPTYWRPNLLWGFRTVAPQNFGRHIFDDLEAMKVNNLEGTDFDCYYDQWAEFGFTYYMLSKGMLNPDHLDYDTIAADYFEKGFGPAAPAMKKYYDLLEKHFDKCAAPRTEPHGFYPYSRTLDIDALQRCFDEARALARGDAAVLRRIANFEIGLVPARFEKEIVEAYDRQDAAAGKAAQAKFIEWTKTEAPKHMSSVNPLRYWSLYSTPTRASIKWVRQ